MKQSVPAVPVIRKSRGVRACIILVAPLILLGTFLPSPAVAGPLFAAPFLSYDTGRYPNAVAVGDLNGDGNPDLTTASATIGMISVLLGAGDGTFGPSTDYPAAGAAGSVAIGDLNADGKLDAAVPTPFGGGVAVMLGNGDGTFGPPTVFTTGTSPGFVAIGDVNGDGRPDLVTVYQTPYFGNNISVLLGNGDGTFVLKGSFTTSQGPLTVAIGDLNGDGRADLAISIYGYAGTGSQVGVTLGNGDGTFGPETDYQTTYAPECVAIRDLNGDGRPDLAVAGSGVSVHLGNGNGTFQPKSDYGVSGHWIAIGDLNADGKLDLAVAVSNHDCSSCGHTSVLFGNGDGTFGPNSDFGAGVDPSCVAIADLNGDGRPDLTLANLNSTSVSVLLGNGDGTFGAKVAHETGTFPTSVAMADLNGDGNSDLAVANGVGNSVSIFPGNGDGTFAPRSDFGTGGTPSSLAIGDLNGDGRPDLAAVNNNHYAVAVLLGNGDGTFGSYTEYAAGFLSRFVAIGDLNSDGKLDLVVTIGYAAVSVLLGNGDGTFPPGNSYETGFYPIGVAIGDLNGDGKLDLAVANENYQGVSVLLGNGDGTFQPKTDYATGGGSTPSVALGDLNGDGKLDLAAGEQGFQGASSVAVRLGNGDGTFGPRSNFATGYNPKSMAIRDLDADGKPDVAMANADANTISVLRGNGDGTLGPKTDHGSGAEPVSLAVGDLNGDGKPDLAVANRRSNTVSVLINTGPAGCPPVPMTLDLAPSTLNPRSKGHWVTATLEPEPPASPADIDVASILMNGSVPVDASGPISIGDADGDGRPDLMVKLSRAALELSVTEGEAVEVTVTGHIGAGCFEATDRIRVIRSHVTAPSAGSVLQAGSSTAVRWDTPAGVSAASVALLWSSDDGASWTLAAKGLPNTSYLWSVPSSRTERARVAVVVESADASGPGGVLAMSDRFVITATLGVRETGLGMALHGATPNPGRDLTVSFSLAGGEPASLVVYDLSGRQVSRRDVGELGAGPHVVKLAAAGRLAPGLYLVHLVQGDRRLVARAVVVR